MASVDGGPTVDARVADATVADVGGIAITVSPGAGTLSLGTSLQATVTVTSNEFVGDVALSAANAPTSWTTTFSPATLSFTGSGTLTATLDIEVPSTGEFGAIAAGDEGTITLEIVGEGGDKDATAALAVAADNAYIIRTAEGIDDTLDHGWPEAATIKKGAVVRFIDDDSMAVHRVHSEPHQQNDNPVYEFVTSETGEIPSYCHSHQNTNFITRLTVTD